MADPRGDYYVVQGALTFAKRENFAYAACATCNKKVFESGGTFTCETCQKTLDSSGVTQRYIVSATIGDPTGTAFVTFFNESAAQLFGLSAAELIALRDTSSAAFDDKFTQILFKPSLFKIRSRVDDRSDDHRIRYNVVALMPFSFAEDTATKLHDIHEYMRLPAPTASASTAPPPH